MADRGDAGVQSAQRAVLFADVCDSTALYESLGDAPAQALINTQFEKLAILSNYGGESVILRRILAFDGPVTTEDEAKAAIPTAEYEKATRALLDDAQNKRLDQIILQQSLTNGRESAVFTNAAVVGKLNLDDQQRERIKAIREERSKGDDGEDPSGRVTAAGLFLDLLEALRRDGRRRLGGRRRRRVGAAVQADPRAHVETAAARGAHGQVRGDGRRMNRRRVGGRCRGRGRGR